MSHEAPYRMMDAHRTNLAPAVQGRTCVGAGYGVVQGTGPCAGDDEGAGEGAGAGEGVGAGKR